MKGYAGGSGSVTADWIVHIGALRRVWLETAARVDDGAVSFTCRVGAVLGPVGSSGLAGRAGVLSGGDCIRGFRVVGAMCGGSVSSRIMATAMFNLRV